FPPGPGWATPFAAQAPNDLSPQNQHPCGRHKRRWGPPDEVVPTSKCAVRGETILLCQKKNQSNGRAKTNAKVCRLPLRLANLCAKKWNILGKANMALARLSRQSPSACQKRGGLE